jgi:uncharacterized protein
MDNENLIKVIKQLVQAEFNEEATGHDWHHIERVYNTACYLQSKEGGDRTIIELAALLHDISDHKFNGGKLDEGGNVAYKLLIENNSTEETAEKVKEIINSVSFKGANVIDKSNSLEAKIVQDADRLDAIGAIGIARAFAFGGNRNRPIYSPSNAPTLHDTFEEYANSKSHTINHFHEKLLLLKNRLHTETAKTIGNERHLFMENFLIQFHKEWELNTIQK